MAIDDSLALVRLRLYRTVNNTAVSTDAVTATPTVPAVTTPGHHGYHDLVPVTSTADPDDPTVPYLDLVATKDPTNREQREVAWRIRLPLSSCGAAGIPSSPARVATLR